MRVCSSRNFSASRELHACASPPLLFPTAPADPGAGRLPAAVVGRVFLRATIIPLSYIPRLPALPLSPSDVLAPHSTRADTNTSALPPLTLSSWTRGEGGLGAVRSHRRGRPRTSCPAPSASAASCCPPRPSPPRPPCVPTSAPRPPVLCPRRVTPKLHPVHCVRAATRRRPPARGGCRTRRSPDSMCTLPYISPLVDITA